MTGTGQDGSDRNSIVALERVEPRRNVYRYNVLSVEPTLFEDASWCASGDGSGGGPAKGRASTDRAETQVELEVWLACKLRRGYREAGGGAQRPRPRAPTSCG